MEERYWYAIETDEDDNDWGTGSFDWDEAVEMAKSYGCKFIAKIDGGYDEQGHETTDPICVSLYESGEDF